MSENHVRSDSKRSKHPELSLSQKKEWKTLFSPKNTQLPIVPFPNLGWNTLATETAHAKDSKDVRDEVESILEENDLTERMNTEQLHAFLDAKLNFDECSLTHHLNEGSNASRYEFDS